VNLAEFFADFSANHVEEEDEVEESLDERGRLVEAGEDPEVITGEEKDGCECECPCPTQQEHQACARSEKAGGEHEEEHRIVSARDSEDDYTGEHEQIERNGGKTGERQKFARRRGATVLFGTLITELVRLRAVGHSECR
jgi:hypothetical protein